LLEQKDRMFAARAEMREESQRLKTENKRLRAENAKLACGYAERLGDHQENGRLRVENQRLTADAELGALVRKMPGQTSLRCNRPTGSGNDWQVLRHSIPMVAAHDRLMAFGAVPEAVLRDGLDKVARWNEWRRAAQREGK